MQTGDDISKSYVSGTGKLGVIPSAAMVCHSWKVEVLMYIKRQYGIPTSERNIRMRKERTAPLEFLCQLVRGANVERHTKTRGEPPVHGIQFDQNMIVGGPLAQGNIRCK